LRTIRVKANTKPEAREPAIAIVPPQMLAAPGSRALALMLRNPQPGRCADAVSIMAYADIDKIGNPTWPRPRLYPEAFSASANLYTLVVLIRPFPSPRLIPMFSNCGLLAGKKRGTPSPASVVAAGRAAPPACQPSVSLQLSQCRLSYSIGRRLGGAGRTIRSPSLRLVFSLKAWAHLSTTGGSCPQASRLSGGGAGRKNASNRI